jgi:hypothetical protein
MLQNKIGIEALVIIKGGTGGLLSFPVTRGVIHSDKNGNFRISLKESGNSFYRVMNNEISTQISDIQHFGFDSLIINL